MADDTKLGGQVGSAAPSAPATSPTDQSMAQQTKQAADFQAMYSQGGKFKEQVEAFAAARGNEKGGESAVEAVQEVPSVVELEKKPELAGYIEKVERGTDLAKPIVDDYTGQVLINPPQTQDVTVTLPLSEEQVKLGLHHKIWDSVRWLAEWCMRQVRLLHGKVRYKQD